MQLTFKCVFVSSAFCHHSNQVFYPLENSLRDLNEMLEKSFINKHLNGINVSIITELWSTILNVGGAYRQVRIKMWKKRVKESIRADSIQLMTCVTWYIPQHIN